LANRASGQGQRTEILPAKKWNAKQMFLLTPFPFIQIAQLMEIWISFRLFCWPTRRKRVTCQVESIERIPESGLPKFSKNRGTKNLRLFLIPSCRSHQGASDRWH